MNCKIYILLNHNHYRHSWSLPLLALLLHSHHLPFWHARRSVMISINLHWAIQPPTVFRWLNAVPWKHFKRTKVWTMFSFKKAATLIMAQMVVYTSWATSLTKMASNQSLTFCQLHHQHQLCQLLFEHQISHVHGFYDGKWLLWWQIIR